MNESDDIRAIIIQWLALEDLRLAGDYDSKLAAVLRRGSSYKDTVALFLARIRLDDFRVFSRSLSLLLDYGKK